MPVQNFHPPGGRLVYHQLESSALAGNQLGDPSRRSVAVYLPEESENRQEGLPLIVYLAAYAGSGLKKISWQLFGESLIQRIDRLVLEGRMGPVITIVPDCFTSLGGNQYIDTPILGNWETFLADELLPWAVNNFKVLPHPRHRAVLGYSSGGYGALVQGMRRGAHWGAIACHSGDIGFDIVYRNELPRVLTHLSKFRGGVQEFLQSFRDSVKVTSEQLTTLMILAMAASYAPDPQAFLGIRLPVDPLTCEIDGDRWSRWLRHDPLDLIEEESCRENLRGLTQIVIDCGRFDQYQLHFGARRFSRRLEAFGIPHVYEEFDDNHSDIDYRLDRSLPLLYDAIAPDRKPESKGTDSFRK